MVQHSILRKKHHLANSSIVYYNFDKGENCLLFFLKKAFNNLFRYIPDGFEDHLNGVTRFLIYLGTMAEHSATTALYFFSLPKKHRILAQLNALERGSTILIPQSFLTNSQVIDYVCMYVCMYVYLYVYMYVYVYRFFRILSI